MVKEDEVEKRKKKLEEEQKRLDAEQAGEAEEPPKATSMIDSAKEQADRLEAANKKTEELVERQEELAARNALGGESEAGAPPEPPKEETPEGYAARISAGEVKDEEGKVS